MVDYMESVKNLNDINNLKDNQIIGKPEIINSVINFKGYNNILFCEGNVKLVGAKISFEANNSLIYLSSSRYNQYPLNIVIYNDSTIFIGKNNNIGSANINVQENQNLIIGNDGIIGNGVNIRTSDAHSIYDIQSKERINFSYSVFIGDHVWLGHLAYISRGVKIGSGAIVDNYACVPPLFNILSNSFVSGNPAKPIKNNVFFTKDFLGDYKTEDSFNSFAYKSDVFIYDFVERETLVMDNLNQILKDLNVDQRLEFVQKLFVRNKRKNRFTII